MCKTMTTCSALLTFRSPSLCPHRCMVWRAQAAALAATVEEASVAERRLRVAMAVAMGLSQRTEASPSRCQLKARVC